MKAYLNLYWILEYNSATKDELVSFWTRFLDPHNVTMVKKEIVIDLFDKLSKGRFSKADYQLFR